MSAPLLLGGLWLALSVATWAVYRRDKGLAQRGQRRTPERTLLLLALVGGWPGALWAMYLHRQRHKASKPGFYVPLWAIVGLWAVAAVVWQVRR